MDDDELVDVYDDVCLCLYVHRIEMQVQVRMGTYNDTRSLVINQEYVWASHGSRDTRRSVDRMRGTHARGVVNECSHTQGDVQLLCRLRQVFVFVVGGS